MSKVLNKKGLSEPIGTNEGVTLRIGLKMCFFHLIEKFLEKILNFHAQA